MISLDWLAKYWRQDTQTMKRLNSVRYGSCDFYWPATEGATDDNTLCYTTGRVQTKTDWLEELTHVW